jgi:hypothetical protein
MPAASITQEMPCSSAEVFALLHDYDRRLEWDTLLREARLTRGCTIAQKGATSLCIGKHLGGCISIETKYLTFKPGEVAAVEMINETPFFEHFAASIRHADTPTGSLATYRFQFTARPRFLRWILHPVMRCVLEFETKKRLRALSNFLTKQ